MWTWYPCYANEKWIKLFWRRLIYVDEWMGRNPNLFPLRPKLVQRNNQVVSDNFYPLLYLDCQRFNRALLQKNNFSKRKWQNKVKLSSNVLHRTFMFRLRRKMIFATCGKNFLHKFKQLRTLLHFVWNFLTCNCNLVFLQYSKHKQSFLKLLKINCTQSNDFHFPHFRMLTMPYWNRKERNTQNLYTSSRINYKNWRVMPMNQEKGTCHPMFFWKDKGLSWVSD